MDNIKEKIAKLFALANNNSNENEIAIALGKAQKLMEEYNLSQSDIFNEKYVTVSVRYNNGKNGEDWKDYFGQLVAKINFCKVFSSYAGPILYFFGKEKNVNLCIYQFNNIIAQMEIICERKFNEYKFNGGNIHEKTWKKSFYFGAYTEIKNKLDVIKKSNDLMLDTIPGQKQALMVLESELTLEYQKAHPNLKNVGTRFNINAGFEEGRNTGKEFSFQNSLK